PTHPPRPLPAGKMAEVDELIVLQLKGVGLDLGSAKTVGDFDSPLLYKAAHRCCELISRDAVHDNPDALPAGMSQRFKATSDLASAIRSLGYPDDLTFNQLMYPTPADVKGLLSWLCQALPSRDKAADVHIDEEAGTASLVANAWELLDSRHRACERKLQERKAAAQRVWPPLKSEYPAVRRRRPVVFAAIHPFLTPASTEEADWCERHVPFTALQVDSHYDLFPSLIAFNAAQYAKEKQDELEWESAGKNAGMTKKEYRKKKRENMEQKLISASVSTTKFQGKFKSAPSAEAVELKIGKSRFMKEKQFGTEAVTNDLDMTELEETVLANAVSQHEHKKQQKIEEEGRLKKQLKKVSASILRLSEEAEESEKELARLQQEQETDADRIKEVTEDGDALEEMYNIYQQALELCDDPNNNEKLQEKMDAAQSAYEELEKDWQTREKKMKGKYELGKQELEKANGRLQLLYDEIDEAKAKMKELKVSAKKKEEERERLEAELLKLPKDVERDNYLQRILDIVKNISKQQDEGDKIAQQSLDTKAEIEEMQLGLKQAFLVAEEKCYNELKQDAQNEYGRAVYRQLISLREAFQELLVNVEDQGKTNQSLFEFDERIDKLKNRNQTLNTKSVNDDLSSLKVENDELGAELKELRSRLKALVK
ncbi:Coiled-coil domain-containing protein 22-like protein, partial [Diplonema papillatum]